MASLYELSSDYLQVLDIPDDEITEEERVEVINIIREEITNKSVNSFYYIRNKESELESIENEIRLWNRNILVERIYFNGNS